MDDYVHNNANITAMRLFQREAPETQAILKEMISYQNYTGNKLLRVTRPLPIMTVTNLNDCLDLFIGIMDA